MRVIQTRNDTIRLIFNPKTDGLCLSDFLIVRDGKDNFLGQIVEIYDDKFNQEENVASIRLVYRILPDYEIVPYDNFTPSRECEIAKIKLEEIEKCINVDKTTVPFGISTKNGKVVNLNLDFFNNNPVVFADKLDQVNCAFENIAQKLKAFKKVVVIDYTGNLSIKNAKRIKAKEDFKLPLDFYTLDFIKSKALKEASMEAQAELEDMFSELKKFVNSTEDKYIPFPKFVKVIEQQYKATPADELKSLLIRLKRYWNENLFSRSKKEFQGLNKAIQKENVVIVDLSDVKFEWHKEFLEYTVRQANEFEAYLLLRLNENNSNPELINDLYLKHPNLNIISSISYGFAKLPALMEFANNYILYKTLNPRRDFGFANFQIAALNSASFMAFGKDTMDFIFVLKNYIFDEEDKAEEEEKKIYINLNLELEEMTSVELAEGNFELKNVRIPKRLDNEVALDDILPEFSEKQEEKKALNTQGDNSEEFKDIPLVKEESVPDDNEAPDETSDIQDEADTEAVSEYSEPQEEEAENLPYTLEEVGASSNDVSEIIEETPDTKEEADADMAELIEASLRNDEEYIKEVEVNEEGDDSKEAIPVAEEDLDYFISPSETPETTDVQTADETIEADETPEISEVANEPIEEEIIENETSDEEAVTPEMIEDAALNENVDEEPQTELSSDASVTENQPKQASSVPAEPAEAKEDPKEEAKKDIIIVKEKPNLMIDDYSEPEPASEPEAVPEAVTETVPDEKPDEDGISLQDLAKKSIEVRFDEVIGETKKAAPKKKNKNELKINENVTIDLDAIKNDKAPENELPVFKNDNEDDEDYNYDFQEGMKVSHEKYGLGNILKVVKYSDRCLLQIEFEQAGKRLLDPKIARIKPV